MLQMFYLDVAYVCKWFSSVFQMFFKVFHTHVSSVSCFVRMLQVFRLDVLKVNLVLQLVFRMHVLSAFRRMLQVLRPDVFKSRSGVTSMSSLFCCLTFAWVSPPPLSRAG
jgi:hypothetical protein